MIDLLIAGGGPAGLATALYARRAGLTAVVVEPRTAPIDKACGEGLMPQAVGALAELGVAPRGMPISGIRYLQDGDAAVAPFPHGAGLGVRRVELHRALSEAVCASGVEVRHGSAERITQDGESVAAAGLRARYLVGADGLHSRVRRQIGAERAARGGRRWGVQAHLPIAPWSEHVEVYWAPAGEAYVTPVAPDCVGVALLGGRGGGFTERLAAFGELSGRLGGVEPGPALAAGPMRQDVARRVSGRVLLVGDAAGYLDALTGEGLALALACARAAVARVATGETRRYERDYLALSRRYRLITASLLWAAANPVLRPRIVFGGERKPDAAALEALHHEAHAECFIASSVKSDIRVEPRA